MTEPHTPRSADRPKAARFAIGCMTGTSLDGLDTAVVRASGLGLELTDVSVVGWDSRPIPDAEALRRIASGDPVDAGSITACSLSLGQAHAEGCAAAWSNARATTVVAERPDLVCVHGQTVFHRPPLSWQLINPWPIAHRMRCPVAFDLRGSDLAGGGEGAPITPIADWLLYRSKSEHRVIVNLGGFCNATLLPKGGELDATVAFDVSACNQVLDYASQRTIGLPFDPDGSRAAQGEPSQRAVDELAGTLIGARQCGPSDKARSLGTGDEATAWVDQWLPRLEGPDLLASACAGIARAIGHAIRSAAPETGTIALAGGSVRNRTLVRAIELESPGRVVELDALPTRGPAGGFILPGQREAAAFALLGLLLSDGVEITLPGVTGRSGSIPLSGAWIAPPPIRPTAGTF